MPTRIDIELTSAADDGSWTWRAAGARQPRGVLDGSILPPGAAVGDQLKAESEHDVDGIRILSIVPPKQKAERSDVLDLLPASDFEPVIQQRSGRDRHDGGRPRPRRERDRDDRGGRGDRGDRPPRGDRTERGDRPERDRRGGGRRDSDAGREGAERSREGREGRERRTHRPHFTPPPELPQRPKPKRLRPGKQHLTEVLTSIPEEQRPVAELALQGMPAVRQRLREDNARLKAEDKPQMPEATVLRLAEDLLPQLRVAEWLDRAEAAKRQLEHLDLRDLRSVVAASDDPAVARDESTRTLATELKGALVVKQDEELNLWLADVEAAVDVGRVVRALRLSAVPPKAGVPFPSHLGAKLGPATNAALTPGDPPDRWIAVLEAAAFSPVRALVAPTEAPAQPGTDLIATVTRLGPLLPQVAALFGVEVPDKAPTPKPLRPTARKKESGPKRAQGTSPRQQPAAAPAQAPPDAVADQTRSEPDAAPVADEATSQPDTAPRADEAGPEPDAAPVVDEASPEPDARPVVDEASPEPDAASVVDEASPGPDAGPVVDEASPEPDAGTVVDEASPEPDAGTVVDEASPEPDAASVVDEAAPEPDAAPVVDEAAPEPDAAPVADETAAEPNAERAADQASPAPDTMPPDDVAEDEAVVAESEESTPDDAPAAEAEASAPAESDQDQPITNQ